MEKNNIFPKRLYGCTLRGKVLELLDAPGCTGRAKVALFDGVEQYHIYPGITELEKISAAY